VFFGGKRGIGDKKVFFGGKKSFGEKKDFFGEKKVFFGEKKGYHYFYKYSIKKYNTCK
jgi:hypothetical protein